jgi:DNA-binding CsgD family transcriptional regulator/tetratricopeptide (TPR) repeat protein
MTGRIEEQAYLKAAIADPLQVGVLVAGGAGVGKTRLLREVTEGETDNRVEFITATESARPLPFGACAHLLPEGLGAIDQLDLLAVIGRHLIRQAEGKSVILAVDDMHLLDTFSAALVHYFAISSSGKVLLTLRSGESAPDALTALHRDGIVTRLELQPLSRLEFDALVDGALGGRTESFTLDRIWAVTEGNVLFARELISDALGAGALVLDRGTWRWTGGLGAAPRLRETMTARLGTLSPEERTFLEILAVGEPLNLVSTQHLAPGISVPDLERRSLLTTESADRRTLVRFAHPLFGETLRIGMPDSLRRQINHDLAEDLAGGDDKQPGDALRLALLRDAAGEVADPGLLAEAARNANLLSDYALAESLARASAFGGYGFSAQLELALALVGQRRLEEAKAVIVPLIGTEPDDAARELLADAVAQALGHGLGLVDEAIGIMESIERDVTDAATRALVQCHRATLLVFGGRFEEAAELGIVALKSAKDDSIFVRSLAPVGTSLVMNGRINEALAFSDGALEAALRVRDRLPRAPGWVMSSRITALFFAGRLDEALGLLDMIQGASSKVSPKVMAAMAVYRGRLFLSLGKPRTAVQLLNDAAATFRNFSINVESSWCLALIAEALALLGRHDEARAAVAEALNLRRPAFLATQVDEMRALAWVDAQVGLTSSAIEQLFAAADLAGARGQRSFEIFILHDLLRLGEHQVAERTREVAERVDGAWSAAISAHAAAIHSGDTVALETAAETFAAIGSSLVAAELWGSASAARQTEGLRARANAAARRSFTLAQLCEGARTPALVGAVTRTPLTRRERETATLAADGATNAEIAAVLTLSERTVESHLYSTFAKLGISDRNQLADALQA